MGFINWCDTHYGDITVDVEHVVRYKDFASPDPASWLSVARLDSGDRSLRDAIVHYYQRHKAAPSVEWARRRSNELETERKQQKLTQQIKPVTAWLTASEMALKQKLFAAPRLTEWRVVTPADATELCTRAQRDGLCVVDAISRLATGSDDMDTWVDRCTSEGVCTLLFSTDPTCRTIVGLDADGVCTSEHHCTGRDNEVDEEAWKRFKA